MSDQLSDRSSGSGVSVPVEGGVLRVGILGAQDPDAPTVIAVHGITASHRCWLRVATDLPEVRIIAPDLRGRGRSNALPGPYGLRQHAADLERVLDHFKLSSAVAVGHSMGAFVPVLLAARAPQRVAGLVLVDGGFPLALPEGVDPDAVPLSMLGPAADRLRMTFESRGSYRDFWRGHPAFADGLSPEILDYLDYDLDGEAPAFRASGSVEAVTSDAQELYGSRWYLEALRSLRMPVTVLRSPRGLLAELPGLYPPGRLEAARAEVPQLEILEVPDVNHYTILMAEPGASVVAAAVRSALAVASPSPN